MNQTTPKSDLEASPGPQLPTMSDNLSRSSPDDNPTGKWSITNKPTIVGLICFAGIGFLALIYQLFIMLGVAALWILIAVISIGLAVTHRRWRPKFDRVTSVFSLAPKKEKTLTPLNWAMFFLGALGMAFVANKKNPHGQIPVYDNINSRMVAVSPPQIQRRDATLRYWGSAVANFHTVRFATPAGQESAEQVFDRTFVQLRQLTQVAHSLPTVNVDADLVQMAKRHLELENSILQFKQQFDESMKSEKLARPNDTVDQRMELTRLLLGLIELNPDVLKNMEPGPIRDLIEKALAIEQQRLEQLREIEIMQAVLQERYKGASFPLPNVN